jgi:hypothetical protein
MSQLTLYDRVLHAGHTASRLAGDKADKERHMRSQPKANIWRAATWTLVCLLSMGLVFSVVAGV